MLEGLSRYGYRYRQILLKPVGQATSDAGGMAELYVGVEPLGARVGGSEVKGVTAVSTGVEMEKVVYERPWPNA